jgi:hypothetical protein
MTLLFDTSTPAYAGVHSCVLSYTALLCNRQDRTGVPRCSAPQQVSSLFHTLKYASPLIMHVVWHLSVDSMEAQSLLHPLDESSAAFLAVSALFERWTTLGEGLPDVPPLAPMVLHALLSKEDALVFAAGRDSPCFVKLLNAQIWPNETLVTALCAAITNNRLRPVEVLFHCCIDINGQVNGRTPLSLAAEVGNPEIMHQLLRRFPTVGEDESLWYAVANKHLECAEMLLEAGETPEPWHADEAIWDDDEPLLRLLLSYGLAVDMSLLKEALYAKAPQLLPILAACVTQTTALKMALLAEDGQMVQMLLDTLSDTELQMSVVVVVEPIPRCRSP